MVVICSRWGFARMQETAMVLKALNALVELVVKFSDDNENL